MGRRRIAKKSEELENAMPLTTARHVYKITWQNMAGVTRKGKGKFTREEAEKLIKESNEWLYKIYGKRVDYKLEHV